MLLVWLFIWCNYLCNKEEFFKLSNPLWKDPVWVFFFSSLTIQLSEPHNIYVLFLQLASDTVMQFLPMHTVLLHFMLKLDIVRITDLVVVNLLSETRKGTNKQPESKNLPFLQIYFRATQVRTVWLSTIESYTRLCRIPSRILFRSVHIHFHFPSPRK